jgi:hypothetical protein
LDESFDGFADFTEAEPAATVEPTNTTVDLKDDKETVK